MGTQITFNEPVGKSRKRTSFEEFCVVNRIRPEIKAGFRIWLKGNYFHFDDEWARLYTQYKNRKL